VTSEPSRTIILRGLHHDITEKVIGAELMMLGMPVKDIRLIRKASGLGDTAGTPRSDVLQRHSFCRSRRERLFAAK